MFQGALWDSQTQEERMEFPSLGLRDSSSLGFGSWHCRFQEQLQDLTSRNQLVTLQSLQLWRREGLVLGFFHTYY